ncbi:MAG: lipoate--protein ligase family protein [Chlorobi bacterium]|nr:lipoate--protein ligase family protein [Chlorobiota bacterium]
MAFDRALMQSFLDGRFQRRFGAGSCLWRFYGWEPFAVTIGYNQDISTIDGQRCRQEGIDVVRRPTGGRAVFHADEFTYSFLAETEERNALIYRMVHEMIMLALQELGIRSEFCRSTPGESRSKGSPVTCFTASARYELQVNGRKLVGSAQRRSRNILLQHGSLPLTGKHKDIARLVASPDESEDRAIRVEMERKTVSLQELLGYIPPYGMLAELMRQASFLQSGIGMTMLDYGDLEALLQTAAAPSTS